MRLKVKQTQVIFVVFIAILVIVIICGLNIVSTPAKISYDGNLQDITWEELINGSAYGQIFSHQEGSFYIAGTVNNLLWQAPPAGIDYELGQDLGGPLIKGDYHGLEGKQVIAYGHLEDFLTQTSAHKSFDEGMGDINLQVFDIERVTIMNISSLKCPQEPIEGELVSPELTLTNPFGNPVKVKIFLRSSGEYSNEPDNRSVYSTLGPKQSKIFHWQLNATEPEHLYEMEAYIIGTSETGIIWQADKCRMHVLSKPELVIYTDLEVDSINNVMNYTPEKEMAINFEIHNIGGLDDKNVTVSLSDFSLKYYNISASATTWKIDSLPGGGQKNLTTNLSIGSSGTALIVIEANDSIGNYEEATIMFEPEK